MVKIFIYIVSISIIFSCSPQRKVLDANCPGSIIDVGLSIKGQPPCDYCVMDKQIFSKGIFLDLKDSLSIIDKFKFSYYSGENLSFQKEIKGKQITGKLAKFLDTVKTGDMLSFECIRVRKGDLAVLSTNMSIVIK